MNVRFSKYPLILILLFFTSYCILFKIFQYVNFNGIGFEFVYYFEQTFWNTLNGRFMITGREFSYFVEHLPIILLIIYPIYYLIQSPYTILIIHALACSLAIIPLYYLSEHYFHDKIISMCISIMYVVLIYTINGLEYEVHMEIFYPVFFFSLFYFLIKKRWAWFYIFLLLSLFIKEDASIAIIGLGIFIILNINKKHGIITIILSIIYLITAVFIIIPYFRTGDYQYFSYWSVYGSTVNEMLLNMLNPIKQINIIFTKEKVKSFLMLFSTFAFLPCFSWRNFLFLLAPCLYLAYSSNNPHFYELIQYYGLLLVPFLFFTTLLNLSKISYKLKFLTKRKIFYLIIIIIIINFFHSRMLMRFEKIITVKNPQRIETVKKIIDLIPEGCSVEAQDNLIAHISPRKKRILFPEGYGTDYIIIDTKGNKWPLNDEAYENELRNLNKDTNYVIVEDKENYILYKKQK